MQASSSRQLKEVGRVIVARPVFLRSAAYKTLNSYHDTAYIYIKRFMAIVVGVLHIAQNQIFLKNSQNTIDKCTII